MNTRWLAMVLVLGACGDNTAPPPDPTPVGQCMAVRTAYVQHATDCGEYFGLREYQADQQPADCASAPAPTRDIATCVAWLNTAPCDAPPEWVADPSCLGLFR